MLFTVSKIKHPHQLNKRFINCNKFIIFQTTKIILLKSVIKSVYCKIFVFLFFFSSTIFYFHLLWFYLFSHFSTSSNIDFEFIFKLRFLLLLNAWFFLLWCWFSPYLFLENKSQLSFVILYDICDRRRGYSTKNSFMWHRCVKATIGVGLDIYQGTLQISFLQTLLVY